MYDDIVLLNVSNTYATAHIVESTHRSEHGLTLKSQNAPVRKTVSIWWAAGVLRNPIVSRLVHCTGINLCRTKGLVLTFFLDKASSADRMEVPARYNNRTEQSFPPRLPRLLVYVSRSHRDTITVVGVICSIIKLVLADVVSKLCLSDRTQL